MTEETLSNIGSVRLKDYPKKACIALTAAIGLLFDLQKFPVSMKSHLAVGQGRPTLTLACKACQANTSNTRICRLVLSCLLLSNNIRHFIMVHDSSHIYKWLR